MFIPNKTYHIMRLGVVGVIAALILVIAGESVLFLKMQKGNSVVMDSLTTNVTTLSGHTKSEFRNVDARSSDAEKQIKDLQEVLTAQMQTISSLQEALSRTQTSVDKLLKNECTPETAIYVLTRDMVAVCRSLGVQP